MKHETYKQSMRKGIARERNWAVVFIILGILCFNEAGNFIHRKGFAEGILASDISEDNP